MDWVRKAVNVRSGGLAQKPKQRATAATASLRDMRLWVEDSQVNIMYRGNVGRVHSISNYIAKLVTLQGACNISSTHAEQSRAHHRLD